MEKSQILIVEDDGVVALDIENRLKNLGYSVPAKVAFGEEAIQKAEKHNPDIVLMDIVLKGEMDGIEAAEIIRARFGTPVIFLTGYADEGRLERAKLTIPFGYILKPFQDRDLKIAIEMALYTAKVDADRKQAEESLRQKNSLLQHIADHLPVSFTYVDCDEKYIFANKQFEDWLGQENVLGKTIKEVISPEIYEKIKPKVDIVLAGDNVDFERIGLTGKGDKRCFLTSYRPDKDEAGNMIGFFALLWDITDIKRKEEALRESESKLRQALKMEAIGTLAGGIAHEFNNILGIIIGNTELAIDDVPEWNPAKECLKEIRSASMRAKDVVRHILSFARKTPAQRKPIQISTIIRDSLKLMRASIPTTIEIRQNITCESEMILADPTEINQILMNLCTNSVHALSEETGVLEVSLTNEELRMKNEELSLDPGRYVKLTVKDTGSGINPEIKDRIFDPYFTTKDIGEGTGMGLSVAYGIVKKHDGAIKVQSELGKGTVFEVLFPLIEETVEPEVKEEPKVLPTGSECILFVDDEESLVKMAEQMLKRLGYQVVTKTNPKEALALFKAEADQFDLVITDMAMPQMAGDRLAQELMEIRKDIPVILCTGHSARIDEDRAKELGLAAYVMKPLVMIDFANTVRKVLDAAKE